MFHSFSRLQKVFLRLVIVTRLLSAMCLRERRDGGETVILLLPLLAPGLRCPCVVHSPSLMAQVVQSVEKDAVEKGVVTSCVCFVSDSSSVVAERGSGTESSGVAVTCHP